MQNRIAFFVLALGVTGGCAASDVTHPMGSDGKQSLTATASRSNEPVARSGSLVVTKDCTGFHGFAGETCFIATSNLEAVPKGSVITYKSAAAANGILDTDVTLDPPGPGNNTASGHCFVNLANGLGTCSFSGGTGRFRGFHASVDVTPLGWPMFAWNGKYHYGD